MSTTCNCLAYRRLKAASDDYWNSPVGILRRIDGLAQDFSFSMVNGATKIIGEINGVKWFKWDAVEDERLCEICRRHSQGGRQGFYAITWFMPESPPIHDWCRCGLIAYFYDPFGET